VTALKAEAAAQMRRLGAPLLLTANRTDNLAILRINERFGFRTGPLEMLYERTPV
jgi:hypothetical protein